jgi:uncharacterized protein with GYD domain
MPYYVLLMQLTEKGAADIAGAPRRIDEAVAAWEAAGGTMTVFCATMGDYDYVAVGQAPTDERAASFALALSRSGNVKTTTLRGFTRDELAHMLETLPEAGPEDTRRNAKEPPPPEGTRRNAKEPDPTSPEPPAPEPLEEMPEAPPEAPRRNVK